MTRVTFDRELWCVLVNRNVAIDPEIAFTNVQSGFTIADGLQVITFDLEGAGYGVFHLLTESRIAIAYRPLVRRSTVEAVLADAGWRGWVKHAPNVASALSTKLPVTFEAP